MVAALVCASLEPWPAQAQQGRRAEVGTGPGGLPAVNAVPVLARARAPLSANATLGYGYTEAVIDGNDAHHRAATQLAVGYMPIPALALAARLDGRFDAHTGVAGGSDDGIALGSQLLARGAWPIARTLHAGGEAALRFPGASDPGRGLRAASAELRAALTFSDDEALWVSSLLGFRLDRGRHGVSDPERLSLADRVALSASDSNAVLLGLGVVRRMGALELLGEWTWDVQVGRGAPSAFASAMRFEAGARLFPIRMLHVQILAGVSPSDRPAVAAGEPLAIVEPRFWVASGVGWYFGASANAQGDARAPAPVTSAPPVAGTLRGRVLDAAAGAPVPFATVTLPGRAPVSADAQGNFAIADVPAGTVELRAAADGFRERTESASVAAGATTSVDIALERELPEGQVRGTVRGFDGKPLSARVQVEPLGAIITPAPDGTFELDVQPGEYQLVISAPGYKTQKRSVVVEHNGVTVVIVELSSGE